MTGAPDRRRRVAIALTVVVVVLFLVQIVALATGNETLAAFTFGLFVAGWFGLRSWQRRAQDH